MASARIVYTGPFDPSLCDGVSAATHDLLVFLKSLGREVAIISFMHENAVTRDFFNSAHRHDGIKILSEGPRQKTFLLNGIHVHYALLPFSRDQVIGVHGPVLKHYLDTITACDKACFITADNDFTSFTAHLLAGTQPLHFIHSPFISIAAFNKAPKLAGILRKRTVCTVSDYCRAELNKTLGVEAVTWQPFIDLRRYLLRHTTAESARRIGYYSAGPHKGDELVGELIDEMKDHHFVIMGRCSTIDEQSANVTCLGDVNAMKEFYAQISLLLVPSTIPEGFSRVIIEAAANGIPAIANNTGGIAEALGQSGILLEIEDSRRQMTAKYQQAIRQVLANYPGYRQGALDRARDYQDHIEERSRLHAARLFK